MIDSIYKQIAWISHSTVLSPTPVSYPPRRRKLRKRERRGPLCSVPLRRWMLEPWEDLSLHCWPARWARACSTYHIESSKSESCPSCCFSLLPACFRISACTSSRGWSSSSRSSPTARCASVPTESASKSLPSSAWSFTLGASQFASKWSSASSSFKSSRTSSRQVSTHQEEEPQKVTPNQVQMTLQR